MRRISLNIVQKFLVYLLFLSVIPLLVVGLVSYRNSSDILQADAKRSMTQLINNQREYLELQLNQLASLLINISNVDTIRNILSNETGGGQSAYANLSTQAQVGYILSGYTNLTGLVSLDIFTINGTHYHIGDTLNTEHIRQDAKDRIWTQTFQDVQPVVWIGAEDNINQSSTYNKVLVVSKGMYKIDSATQQSKPVAAIIASYSLDEMYDHFRRIDIGQGAYLVALDAQNRIIYHPDKSLLGTIAPVQIADTLPSNDATLNAQVKNTWMLISSTRSSVTEWKLASLIPLSTFGAQSSYIGSTIMLVLLISFAIVLVTALSFNRSTVQPIREITARFKNLRVDAANQEPHLPVRSKDEVGQLVQWFNTFLDNLAIKQAAEQRLREREQEREQLIKRLEDSLRFKDQFLATMSHELRTPLNAIQGYSGLILTEDISEDIQYMTERILFNSRRLLALINDVLDISRINAQPMDIASHPLVLRELITNWHNDFKTQAASKQIEFELDISPDLPETVTGDEARLTQIAANLLQNALKFTEKGKVSLAASRGNSTWQFSVTDTGIGIPEEWHSLIFEEFRQVDGSSKRKYGGAGLGLSIVKKLCMLMGGTVSVTSEVGVGSTFTVRMPLVIPEVAPVAEKALARSNGHDESNA